MILAIEFKIFKPYFLKNLCFANEYYCPEFYLVISVKIGIKCCTFIKIKRKTFLKVFQYCQLFP